MRIWYTTRLFEEGAWDARISRAYRDAYEVAIDNEDESRARVFAEIAYDPLHVIEGGMIV